MPEFLPLYYERDTMLDLLETCVKMTVTCWYCTDNSLLDLKSKKMKTKIERGIKLTVGMRGKGFEPSDHF